MQNFKINADNSGHLVPCSAQKPLGPKCSTIYNLLRHMLEQHDSFQGENVSQRTTNEPFVCLVCAKSFKYQRNLDTHISLTHTNKHENQCQICDQNFATTYKLKRHMAELHNVTQFGNSIYSEEAKTFNCMVCESVFKRKENLKAHEKTHLDGSKFTCDKCGKQFTVKSSLVQESTTSKNAHRRKRKTSM